MVIDIESGKPVLTNRSGSLSRPAIKLVAVRSIYEIAQSVPTIPIIGTGGVNSGADAIELIMAGATAVEVGSAVYYRGQNVMAEIADEMQQSLDAHGIKSLDEIRGIALV